MAKPTAISDSSSTGAGQAVPDEGGNDVRVVFYPDYGSARVALSVLAGMTKSQVTGLRTAIWEHVGTYEQNVDWSDPDTWIPQRLSGEHRKAALHVWTGTKKQVNPRHMQGHWLLASGYDLLTENTKGYLELTERGRRFVDEPTGAVVSDIDTHEGLHGLLAILADLGPTAPGSIVAPWMTFLQRVSRIRAESTARGFLYHRLRNLLERSYVAKVGRKYEITPAGLAWLKVSGFAESTTTAPNETRRLWDLIESQRESARATLRERLSAMDPYAFEQVIGRLLQAMDYTDVEVTSRSGDKSVDVIGRIALGITEVREVIQVKRQQGNVQRPVLDMLRGALHRFGAVKGTIISLGGFAKGSLNAAFEPGAAPITLIDGDKLLDLLIENGIGVRTRTIELLEFDETEITPG
jgi:restriction system protein